MNIPTEGLGLPIQGLQGANTSNDMTKCVSIEEVEENSKKWAIQIKKEIIDPFFEPSGKSAYLNDLLLLSLISYILPNESPDTHKISILHSILYRIEIQFEKELDQSSELFKRNVFHILLSKLTNPEINGKQKNVVFYQSLFRYIREFFSPPIDNDKDTVEVDEVVVDFDGDDGDGDGDGDEMVGGETLGGPLTHAKNLISRSITSSEIDNQIYVGTTDATGEQHPGIQMTIENCYDDTVSKTVQPYVEKIIQYVCDTVILERIRNYGYNECLCMIIAFIKNSNTEEWLSHYKEIQIVSFSDEIQFDEMKNLFQAITQTFAYTTAQREIDAKQSDTQPQSGGGLGVPGKGGLDALGASGLSLSDVPGADDLGDLEGVTRLAAPTNNSQSDTVFLIPVHYKVEIIVKEVLEHFLIQLMDYLSKQTDKLEPQIVDILRKRISEILAIETEDEKEMVATHFLKIVDLIVNNRLSSFSINHQYAFILGEFFNSTNVNTNIQKLGKYMETTYSSIQNGKSDTNIQFELNDTSVLWTQLFGLISENIQPSVIHNISDKIIEEFIGNHHIPTENICKIKHITTAKKINPKQYEDIIQEDENLSKEVLIDGEIKYLITHLYFSKTNPKYVDLNERVWTTIQKPIQNALKHPNFLNELKPFLTTLATQLLSVLLGQPCKNEPDNKPTAEGSNDTNTYETSGDGTSEDETPEDGTSTNNKIITGGVDSLSTPKLLDELYNTITDNNKPPDKTPSIDKLSEQIVGKQSPTTDEEPDTNNEEPDTNNPPEQPDTSEISGETSSQPEVASIPPTPGSTPIFPTELGYYLFKEESNVHKTKIINRMNNIIMMNLKEIIDYKEKHKDTITISPIEMSKFIWYTLLAQLFNEFIFPNHTKKEEILKDLRLNVIIHNNFPFTFDVFFDDVLNDPQLTTEAGMKSHPIYEKYYNIFIQPNEKPPPPPQPLMGGRHKYTKRSRPMRHDQRPNIRITKKHLM